MTIKHSQNISHRAPPLPALLAAALLVACGNPRPATQAASPAAGSGATDSTIAASTARSAGAADSAAPALTVAPAQHQPGVALEGSWVLRTLEPSRRGPRLHLAIDSASGATFRVRVAFLMQGDVGLDPARFEPTRGEVAPDGTVHLTIQLKGRAEPEGELSGTLVRDTIRLGAFRWAGVDQAAGDIHWLLVREH